MVVAVFLACPYGVDSKKLLYPGLSNPSIFSLQLQRNVLCIVWLLWFTLSSMEKNGHYKLIVCAHNTRCRWWNQPIAWCEGCTVERSRKNQTTLVYTLLESQESQNKCCLENKQIEQIIYFRCFSWRVLYTPAVHDCAYSVRVWTVQCHLLFV